MTKPRMLTIAKTAQEFNVPVNFVRTKVQQNQICHVKSGSRAYVNADKFAEFLSKGEQPPDVRAE